MQELGPVRVLVCTGRLGLLDADGFEAALKPHLAVCRQGGSALVLDFAGVDYISSAGLRVLMVADQQIREQNGWAAVAALTETVAEVFQVSRFDEVYRVFPSVEAARAAAPAG